MNDPRTTHAGRPPAASAANPHEAYWSLAAAQLLADLGSAPAGLSQSEAAKRLRAVGPNMLEVHRHDTVLNLLWRQLRSPLVLVLIGAAIVSGLVGEVVDALIVTAIVLGSALLGFWQEYSASNAVAALRAQLTLQTKVRRDGEERLVPVTEVVPGDLLVLSAGSLVPADAVVLETRDCYANQAMLTGETLPVVKQPGEVAADVGLADRANCLFMGTSLRSGWASALVIRTGPRTEYGQIAASLIRRPPETEFERGIRRFGYLLSYVMLLMVLVVFAANVLDKKPVIDSLLFAIALAVGMTPELLPAIISLNLARGAQKMAKRGVIVRRLEVIENLGSVQVLCTDKTGTLTVGVVRLDAAYDWQGQPSDAVRRSAWLNAKFQAGMANPLDEALVASVAEPPGAWTKLDEIPYDFTRKRLSVLLKEGDAAPLLVTKGAYDSVLAACSRLAGDGEPPLDATARAALDARFAAWSAQGFRVLGVARRQLAPSTARVTREDEADLDFLGFLLFFDPPKADAKATLDELEGLGIELKVITGDNLAVTEHVAQAVGLAVRGVLTGAQLGAMSDEALWQRAARTTLFAEVDPNQKERIVAALRKGGQVVGYMGDGINDAPALHSADAAISVESAVDVAKEAADFVLLKQDLGVLAEGIREGRRTFANTLKYIFTTTSANFGNMFSMAGVSIFLPFLPLLAKQVLLNNFLSDFPAVTLAGDSVDPELVATPHRWDIRFIRRFMVLFGLVSSIFDYVTFGLLHFVFHASPEVFRTGWFLESLLTELVVALAVRTRRPAFRSRPGNWLLWSSIAMSIVAVAIPYAPGAEVFGFVPLEGPILGAILAITALYVVATEIGKYFFYRRHFGGRAPEPLRAGRA